MDVIHLEIWFCKASGYHLPWQCGTPFRWDTDWAKIMTVFLNGSSLVKTQRLLKTSVQGQVIWPQWCTFSVVVLIIYTWAGRVDLLHKLLPVLSLQWAQVWLSGCLTMSLWYPLSTVDLADGLLRLLLLRIYLCIHLFATPTAWPWYFFCMVSCECVGGVKLALLWALCLWLHPWIAVQQRLDYFFYSC